jgi:thiol-disulfide isomerase/thioredoxin
MAVTKTIITSQRELDAQIAEQGSGSKSVFVLFSGAVVPATGKSWCPDCVDAEPVIAGALEKAAESRDVVLLYIPLVREEYRGNAAHWARVHPSFKLERIPTLYKWGKTRAVGSLVEEQCKDAELVADFVGDE